MTTNPHPLPGGHPLIVCAERVTAALDDASGLGATYLSGAEKRSALLVLSTAISRLEEIRLRVLAAGQAMGDVAEVDGSRDAAAWLAHDAHLDPGRARHLTRLASALDIDWTLVGAALGAGDLDTAQAAVITDALRDLPDDLAPALRSLAEVRLVAEARHFDPRRLRILGRRILDVVAPEVAEEIERRQLEEEEAHAHRSTFLRLRRRGDGTTDVHARIADALADRFLTCLTAYTSPRQRAATSTVDAEGSDSAAEAAPHRAPQDRRPHDQRLGHALGAFLEHHDPARMPLQGGDATTLVVTLDHDTLCDQLAGHGVARIGDEPVSGAHARRLACTATIIPVVLGGVSEVLDLGRGRRLFNPARRKALALAHPAYAAEGCDIPAPWCEAHHAGDPWSRGGRTDLAEGVLLCSHHHHRAHDPRYDTTRPPHGTVRFHRRV